MMKPVRGGPRATPKFRSITIIPKAIPTDSGFKSLPGAAKTIGGIMAANTPTSTIRRIIRPEGAIASPARKRLDKRLLKHLSLIHI